MKRILTIFVFAAAFWLHDGSTAAKATVLNAVSPNLVVSQFQAGGGVAFDEFIEIHNTSSSPVDLINYKVVYRSSGGSTDGIPMAEWTTSTILQPGQFYLIGAQGGYDGTTTPDKTYNPTIRSMSGSGGGIAIRQGATDTGAIIDSVGWGSATNIFVEGAVTPIPGDNNSQARKDNGCQDTDNNANDFQNLVPSAPRNSSTTVTCSGGGTTLFAAMNANPTNVTPGGTTLLTVTVVPATTPPSTNITVAANLQAVGGAESQAFFDNGTNGDQTPGDNVFSFLATVAPGTAGGAAPIAGAAVDLQGRVAPVQVVLSVNAPLPNDNPLLLGNPSNATADVANENNYLMQKPQYSLSYNRSKATANWVAWRLDSTWIGTAQRQDDYRPDTTLPAGWYQVQDADYSGSGYDRGHMCPSGDRTRSIADNSATFLMTNMVPQLGANNQGPWNDFENYTRTLAGQGNEIYIFSGVHGSIGTIASGQIVVPQYTWKVVLVLPNGQDDLQRVGKGTRAFGIIVPNFPPLNQSSPWRNFRVTVDAVEALTGHDFFTAVPKNTQELIERRRDRQ
ncbi:MAG: DNA/RNA non-specific endonuclease [Pyrinomonadaceae bacterium]|nr:DNA/RNA non-specific endonuclease [Pyrinomonadaceae bacterium]